MPEPSHRLRVAPSGDRCGDDIDLQDRERVVTWRWGSRAAPPSMGAAARPATRRPCWMPCADPLPLPATRPFGIP